MGILVEELVGLIVWLVANAVYLGSRRTGSRGIYRFLAFWMGLPGTLFSLIFVKEGSQPRITPPPDDEDGLLAEVRRDRWLRAGGKRAEPLPSGAGPEAPSHPASAGTTPPEEGT